MNRNSTTRSAASLNVIAILLASTLLFAAAGLAAPRFGFVDSVQALFGLASTGTGVKEPMLVTNGGSISVFGGALSQYRSRQNGAWDDFNTWEISTDDGGSWANASGGQTPTSADGTVTIRAFNAVYVPVTLVADQVTVETNGSLAVNPGIDLTINDGPGDDLVVQSSSFFTPRGLTTNNGQVNIAGIFRVLDPATFAGNAFTYNGGTLKYETGSLTTTGVEFPSASGPSVVDVSSTGTITLHGARSVPTQLTLGSGLFSTGTNLTLGNGCVILRSNGSISNAPTFAGVVDLIYFDNSVTVGQEFPTSGSALRDLYFGSPINLTLAANATVNGTIFLGDGHLITGGNTLAIASGDGVSRNNGYIIGNLRKTFTANGTRSYEVGTGNGYSPVSVNATAGTYPAEITVSATEGALPAIPNTNKLTRYWTLTQNTGAATANLTFNYLPGDVGGGSIANYQFIKKNGPTITTLAPAAPPTSTQASINGVSSFSDWTLAEPVVPAVTLNTTTLNFADTVVNQPSAPQTKAISGTNLSANIFCIVAGAGFQISADGTAWNDNATFTQSGGSASGTLHTRFSPLGLGAQTVPVLCESTGAATVTYNASGTGIVAPPTITTSVASLPAFAITAAGDISAEQSYTVSGANLTADINVSAPSTDFQVSKTSGSGFGSSVTYQQTGGTVTTQNVYVRFTPQSPGAKAGNVANASSGAVTKNVAVSGTGRGFVVNDLSDAVDAAVGNGICATSTGVCTLRAAAAEASQQHFSGNVVFPITFSITGTINLGSDIISIRPLTILGPGADLITVNGNGVARPFNIFTNAGNATIRGITIRNGFVPFVGSPKGSAIYSDGSGALTLDSVVVRDNQVTFNGAAYVEGSIYKQAGTLTVRNSLLTNNLNADCGGISVFEGALNILNSTIAGNTATIRGGGLCAYTSNVIIRKSTIAQNYAGASGGGGVHMTILSNLTLGDSIIADNVHVNNTRPDIWLENNAGTFTDEGYNLIGKLDGGNEDGVVFVAGVPNANKSFVGTIASPINARLSNVFTTDPVPAIPLLAGSYAIDGGKGVAGITTDQVGQPRPYENSLVANAVGGDGSDMGAYEAQSDLAPPVVTLVGGPFNFTDTFVAFNSAEETFTVAGTDLLGNLTVTAPGTDFQVSTTSGSGFGPSLTFAPTGGTVPTQTVYVRFSPQSPGAKSGNIVASSENAYAKLLALTGTGISTVPTIRSVSVLRNAGAGVSNSTIANVSDANQAEETLSVTVNGSSSATVNGVTVSNIAVNAAGVVTANVEAAAGSSDASFALAVTDSTSQSASATLSVIVLSSCPGTGTWAEQGHPVAPDGAPGDRYGNSVAVSGDTAVIGSPQDDSSMGSVYIYTRSGGVWSQQAKLTASDGVANDYFGFSVSINGDTLVVGASKDDSNKGSAYVFTRSGTVWSQQAKLTASDGIAGDLLGYSVTVGGDMALVSAVGDDGQKGSAYVFSRNGVTWSQQAKLTASDGAAPDLFGYSVSFSGSTAVIGAYIDDAPVLNQGSAYVFTYSGGVWSQQAKLTASDGAANDQFGITVSLSGDTVIVGANLDDGAFTDQGSAYVFTRSGSVWTQQAKLTANDGAATDYFGFSVSLSGDTAVVGAVIDDTPLANQGSAYVFTRSGSVWSQQTRLTASDGAANDDFGIAVAVSGDTIVAGSYLDDTAGGTDTGSAYIYHQNCPVIGDTAVLLSGGHLTVTDITTDSNDTLTMSLNGGNIRVNDPNNALGCGGGTSQVDANTCDIPFASVTGSITVNTGGGIDVLNVNLTNGDVIPPGGLSFNGGEIAPDDDALNIIGGSQGTVTYGYSNTTNGDGTVAMSNFGTITYTGLEPISNTGTATDVVLTLPSMGTAATLADIGGGSSRLSGATFEQTDFANPSGSVTVNRGNATDTLAVNALATNYPSLTIGSAPGGEFSTITFNGAATLASEKSLTGFATGTIHLATASSDLAATGTGAISLTTARDIFLVVGAGITTVNGALTLSGNQQMTPTSGNFTGVTLSGSGFGSSLVRATGSGLVTVRGRGGNTGNGNIGIDLNGNSILGGGTSGTLTVEGKGGIAAGTSSANHGVVVRTGAFMTAPNVSVDATGGGAGSGNTNIGLLIETGSDISANGAITVIGRGGVAPANGVNYGVFINSAPGILSNGGDVSVTGIGGGTADFLNHGVAIAGATSAIRSAGIGNVTVNGTGGGGAASNESRGVLITSGASIRADGTGTVSVTGSGSTGSGGLNNGILVTGANSRIASAGGNVSAIGAEGGGANSAAISLESSGAISSSNGSLTMIGNTMSLDATSSVNGGTGTVNIRQRTNGRTVELGGPDSSTQLGLTDAELDRVTANILNIGNANTGNVNVLGPISQTKSTNISTPIATLVFGSGDLGIFGTVNNPLSVNPGGTLRPGASPGVINSGNLSLGSGSNFAVEIGGATPGNGAGFHDQVNVTGIVDVTGANLSLAAFGGFTPTAGQQYVIINNDSTDAIGGTFAGISEGATIAPFLVPNMQASVSYVGGDGNDVVLTAMLPPAIITLSDPNPVGFGNVTEGNISPAQTYNVSGVNLVADIVVTAPTHYEVSLTQFSGFGASVNIPFGSGTVTNQPVWVRFVPTATGFLSGPITHASSTATTQNKTAQGTGVAAVCTAAPLNMTGWYKGDGNANDQFGVNNGSAIGVAFPAGKVGQAFSFDSNADTVTTGTAYNQAYTQLSLDAWVYPTSHGQGGVGDEQFGRRVISTTQTDGFAMAVHNGFLQADIRLSTTGTAPINATTNPLALNEWSHVAITYDGTAIRGYVNGIEAINQPATGFVKNTVNSGICMMIGNEPDAPCVIDSRDIHWRGFIDEVEIFDRSLSASEVQAIYNASAVGKCLAPEILIEEPVSNVLVDNVGNRDFGSSLVGTPGTTKSFNVRNVGTTTLNINVGSIAVSGGNSGDFFVNPTGMSPTVEPNGNTAFTVQFTAGGDGPRATDLDVPSDDADENPFDIALTGTGIPVADLAITKTDGSTMAAQGATVVYTLSYSNGGPSTATGVVLTETVPAGSTFNSGASTAGWVCVPNGDAGSTCTLAIGTVANGGSGTRAFAVNVLANATGTLSNTATVGSPVFDPSLGNNSATDINNLAPTLGVYPPTTVALSDNVIVTPNAIPIDTTSISVSAPTTFTGKLTANPATGLVSVTNAALANIAPGTYPITVRAFGPGGSSTRTFNLTVIDSPVCAGLNFVPAVNFNVGVSPGSMAVGDFNNDGNQDVVTGNQGSFADDISVLYGLGDATFGGPSGYAAGAGAEGVAVGDFNGDGNQDVVTANFANSVSILLGAGGGGFLMPTTIPVGVIPSEVVVGDFNGDGIHDIAVSNSLSDNVSILIGIGDGTFAAPVAYGAGSQPSSLVVGDFNGDGRQDLATANGFGASVSILLGAGNGTFGAPTNFGLGANPLSIALGDFNGDGVQDLATANFSTNNVSILIGNGNGTFGAPAIFGVDTGPIWITVGDLNGDGDQDLVTANNNSSNVSILIGNGSGSFAAPVQVATGSFTQAVVVGDFDGDGNQDIAAANAGSNSVSILRRTCNTPPTISSNTISAPEGSPVANFTIATAADGEQAPNTLGITVNGGASATVNGVTVSGLSIAAGGAVTANIVAACGATTATFTLVVTDAQSATGTGTLTVNITPNTPPILSYNNPAAITYGSGTVVNPATGPSDNGGAPAVAVLNAGTYTGGISVSAAGVVTFTNAAPAGTHTITIRSTDSCGATTDASFQLTVNKAVLNVNAVAATKVYGNADPTLTATFSGFLPGDNAGNSGITGSPNCTRTAGETVGGSPYPINCAPGTLAAPNYTFITGTPASFTITARPVTVTADAKTKVYGDADPPLTFTTTSLGTGVAIAGALTRAAGETVGGSPYAITQGTVTNANNPNYSITYVGATLTITARPVTVTADAKTKVYGDADPPLTFTTTSLGTGVAIAGTLARTAGETVGGSPYAITQGTVTNANNPNYSITYVGASFTITARPVTVTADAKTKVYGDADPPLTFTTTGLGTGIAIAGALTRTAGETVGGSPYAILQGTVTNANNPNYSITYVGANFTITVRPVTVTADAKAKLYGDADPALTFTTTNLGTGVGIAGALTRTAGETVGGSPYAILQGTVTNANNPNYSITYVGANFTITARPVTVTAAAKTKVYGDADPALTFTTTSLGTGVPIVGALSRVAGETVAGSPYAITQGTVTNANNPNYSITYVGASLTITVRPVTVTADAKTKVFGAADPPLTFTTTSLGSGVPIAGALTRVPGETVAGSPYAILQGTVTNANNTNYSITYVGANLTITSASTTTTVNAAPVGPSIFGQSVTFTATVASAPPGAGTPTGTVTFNIDGNLYCVNTPLNGSQQATCTQAGLPALPAGVRNVVAIYNGDANFNGSSGTLNYTVSKANTTTAITSDDPDPSLVNQPYTVTWTVTAVAPGAGTPTGTVTVNGGISGGTCTAAVSLGGCQLTPTTTGIKTIQATYSGDNNFNTSVSTTTTHTVNVGISGTVRNGLTMAPISGVVMGLYQLPSGTLITTATTNAAGLYTFTENFTGPLAVQPTVINPPFYDPQFRNIPSAATNVTGQDFLQYATAGDIPRRLSFPIQYVVPGAAGSLPVILSSQDNEAFVSFTLGYDINVFAQPPVFVCGANAPGCTITNDTSVLGRVGVTIIPAGGAFTRNEGAGEDGEAPNVGPKEIARLNFLTLPNNLPSTDFAFLGSPVAASIQDASGNPLLTALVPPIRVVFAQGLEGDVAGRNAGSGTFEVADVVQMRRFVTGLDTPVLTHNEYQRADVAPASTKGDGNLNATDLVQTRRYVAGLDATQSAGGAGASSAGPIAPPAGEAPSEIVLGSASATNGTRISLPVRMKTNGRETAVSFAVRYNESRLTDPIVTLANGAPEGAVLTVGKDEPGVIRILIDSANAFTGKEIGALVVEITFEVTTEAPSGDTPMEIEELIFSDANARATASKAIMGIISIAGANPSIKDKPAKVRDRQRRASQKAFTSTDLIEEWLTPSFVVLKRRKDD